MGDPVLGIHDLGASRKGEGESGFQYAKKCVIWQVLFSFQWILFEVDKFQGKLEEQHIKQRSL